MSFLLSIAFVVTSVVGVVVAGFRPPVRPRFAIPITKFVMPVPVVVAVGPVHVLVEPGRGYEFVTGRIALLAFEAPSSVGVA